MTDHELETTLNDPPLLQALHVLVEALLEDLGAKESVRLLRERADRIESGPRGLDISHLTNAWADVLARVAYSSRPDFPELSTLSDAIRGCPMIPVELVEYVAGRLDGSVRRPRGRPRKGPGEGRWPRAANVAFWVSIYEAAFRLQGQRASKNRALDTVAKLREVSLDRGSIERMAYTELSDAPRAIQSMVPTPERADELVKELIEDGVIRLDEDEGIVWLDELDE